MRSRVHLMVACWAGKRSGQPYPKSYVRDQLEWLNRTRHDVVRRVTFIDAYGIDPLRDQTRHPDHDFYLGRALSLGFCVERRSNGWFSYGSYDHMVRIYGTESFTHFVFLEDDYVFIRDDWDKELVDMLDETIGEDEGYLCQLVQTNPDGYRRGVSSIGIVSTKNSVFKRRVCGVPVRQGEFTKFFGKLKDTTFRYKTVWKRCVDSRLRKGYRFIVCSPNLPSFCLPVHCLAMSEDTLSDVSYEVKRED